MRILVSACLLGLRCRYDGESKPCPAIMQRLSAHEWVPVCPEQLGGLPTPRPPSEIRKGRVVNCQGRDVTAQYEKGAEEALRLYGTLGCGCAVLKARSPSCGLGQIYDGTFSGALTEGDGVTARKFRSSGIPVYTEETVETLFRD